MIMIKKITITKLYEGRHATEMDMWTVYTKLQRAYMFRKNPKKTNIKRSQAYRKKSQKYLHDLLW